MKSIIILLKSIVQTLNNSLNDEDIHSVIEQVTKELNRVIYDLEQLKKQNNGNNKTQQQRI